MRNKLIYVAGKVTGLDIKEAKAKFGKASQEIQNLGYETVNPMQLIENPATSWTDAMRKCLIALLHCEAILLLPDARKSKGAMIEYQLAKDLGIRVFNSMDQVKAYANGKQQLMAPAPNDCNCNLRPQTLVISAKVNCETTVSVCPGCGLWLDIPKTECA
jgi:hypothetical protein